MSLGNQLRNLQSELKNQATTLLQLSFRSTNWKKTSKKTGKFLKNYFSEVLSL